MTTTFPPHLEANHQHDLKDISSNPVRMVRRALQIESLPDGLPRDKHEHIADLIIPMVRDAVRAFMEKNADGRLHHRIAMEVSRLSYAAADQIDTICEVAVCVVTGELQEQCPTAPCHMMVVGETDTWLTPRCAGRRPCRRPTRMTHVWRLMETRS